MLLETKSIRLYSLEIEGQERIFSLVGKGRKKRVRKGPKVVADPEELDIIEYVMDHSKGKNNRNHIKRAIINFLYY